MASKLTFRYDKAGDILYIDRCPPYGEQDSEELDHQVGVRLNPRTGTVENVEILFFTKRIAEGESIEVPLGGDLRLSRESQEA